MKIKHRKKGFTLIEVMIAFLILALSMVPIALLLDSIYSKTINVRATGIATFLAQKFMEELTRTGFGVPGVFSTYTYYSPELTEFTTFTVYHEISGDSDFNPNLGKPHTGAGGVNFKRIKVNVFWGDGLPGERVELLKVIGNY